MAICELKNYSVVPFGYGRELYPFDFTLLAGEIWYVDPDTRDGMQTFMRSIATLEYPKSGSYRFLGRWLDFSGYEELLWVKKKIGYVYPRSALVRNLTVRENLALMRSYFENRYAPLLDERTRRLTAEFGLEGVMDIRPDRLGIQDFRKTILVRELSKSPAVFLAERPEEYSGYLQVEQLAQRVRKYVSLGNAFVFFTEDEKIKNMFDFRRVTIREGVVQIR